MCVNAVVEGGRIAKDWSKSLLVNVYKGKGGIKLMEHAVKILERIIKGKTNFENLQHAVWIYGREEPDRCYFYAIFYSSSATGEIPGKEERPVGKLLLIRSKRLIGCLGRWFD